MNQAETHTARFKALGLGSLNYRDRPHLIILALVLDPFVPYRDEFAVSTGPSEIEPADNLFLVVDQLIDPLMLEHDVGVHHEQPFDGIGEGQKLAANPIAVISNLRPHSANA